MRMISARAFRGRATELLRSDDPILITRRGRVAGVFLPWHKSTLSLSFRRVLFLMLTNDVARELRKKRASECDVLRDFEHWRKARLKSRRR